ncbi:hypothetical protein FI667_g4798, partial [Globisporangium splendens]
MNYNSSTSGPAFVPAFYSSSYEDELELEFSAEQVHSDNLAGSHVMLSTFSTSADHHDADEDNQEDALFAPRTMYRDTQHVFASSGPCDLSFGSHHRSQVFNSEPFMEASSAFGKMPVFVLDSALEAASSKMLSSPLSPSSYSDKVDVPQKEQYSFFCVNPTMPSRQSPTKIMDTLKAALLQLDCDFEVFERWCYKVNLLCVAEEIAFDIQLFRVAKDEYEIDFSRRRGDETKFCELAEYIRSLCSDIDDEALPFLAKSLDPWLDVKQEITGRRYAMKEKEALTLIQELNADGIHPDTLYEVTKVVKDRCRHKGNRKLFLQADHASFLKGLKWMLTDYSDDVARFAVFIMQQFAKDCADGEESSVSSFFVSPFDKSSFALLLDQLLDRQRGVPCGKFTSAMIEQVQQSWVFA